MVDASRSMAAPGTLLDAIGVPLSATYDSLKV